MSLAKRIDDAFKRVATEFKKIRNLTGDLSSLTTVDKSNIVNALNELKTATQLLNDNAPNATNTTFSATHIVALISQAKSEILGGAGAAYDTLLEIQTALQNDESGIQNILQQLGATVRFDQIQNLTAVNKTQVQTNIDVYGKSDIGDINSDFVTTFQNALN